MAATMWFELGIVLALAAMVVVVVAAIVERRLTSAVWKRAIWRSALVTLVATLLLEVTGVGPGIGAVFFSGVGGDAPPVVSHDNIGAVPVDGREVSGDGSIPTRGPEPNAPRFTLPSGGSDAVAAGEGVEEADISPGFPSPLVPRDPPEGRVKSEESGGRETPDTPPQTEAYVSGSPTVKPMADEKADASEAAGAPASHQRFDLSVFAPFWAIGAALLIGFVFGVRAMLLSFCWRLPSASLTLVEEVQGVARRLRVQRVRVIQSDRIPAPVAFGIIRPTVAVPTDFEQQHDEDGREVIPTHEVSHLASRDPAWRLATDVFVSLFWWHPALWYLRRRLQVVSELAADEACTAIPQGAERLATCLVEAGRRLIGSRELAWHSMAGDGYRSNLGRRVVRLLQLDGERLPPLRRGRLAASQMVLVLVLVATIFFLSAVCVRSQSAYAQGDSTMKRLQANWSRSLVGVALLALTVPLAGDSRADDEGERERPVVRDGDREREGDRERDERREREVDRDREADRPCDGDHPEAVLHRLHRQREELAEHAHNLEREAHEAREAGNEREFAELRQAVGEVVGKIRRVEQGIEDVQERLNRGRANQREGVERLHHARQEIIERMRDIEHAIRVTVHGLTTPKGVLRCRGRSRQWSAWTPRTEKLSNSKSWSPSKPRRLNG